MDLILSIEAFVRVAETQSFANASRQIGVAKSVVTTRVKQLEEHLGVALFHRSTRALKGTLRIHVLPGFALGHFSKAPTDFRSAYPTIDFEVMVNDRVVDPVKEGLDLMLQIFPPASNSLIERCLRRRDHREQPVRSMQVARVAKAPRSA